MSRVPVDDRTWPRGAVVISVLFTVMALGSVAGIAFGAGDVPMAIAVLSVFAVSFACSFSIFAGAFGHRLRGDPIPGRFHLLELAAVAISFVVLLGFSAAIGGSMFCGVVGGLMSANVRAIRVARANRRVVDEFEARVARDRADASGTPEPVATNTIGSSSPAPVGHALRETLAAQRQRWIAWLIAGVLAATGCVALDAPEVVTGGVLSGAGIALVWVSRGLWGIWLAARDFSRGGTPPRRAFVVLLHDPAPRMLRPILGVWSRPVEPREGRLPKPDQVYRCDEDRDALLSYQGNVVVHEAWVDTGPRHASKPRWVVADAGIALPHRRALFGRWYISSLIASERPDPAAPLTVTRPDSEAELILEIGQGNGTLLVAVAGRFVALAAIGLVLYWLT